MSTRIYDSGPTSNDLLSALMEKQLPALTDQISVIHAVAVVGDADELAAACLDFNADAHGSGVERVFEQLFDYGGGTIHHLAGGDLIGNLVREYADAAHKLSG